MDTRYNYTMNISAGGVPHAVARAASIYGAMYAMESFVQLIDHKTGLLLVSVSSFPHSPADRFFTRFDFMGFICGVRHNFTRFHDLQTCFYVQPLCNGVQRFRIYLPGACSLLTAHCACCILAYISNARHNAKAVAITDAPQYNWRGQYRY